jgi:outer membrane protein TolC
MMPWRASNSNYPIFNRDAKALHRRALLTREQAQKALENLSQLVEVDVRTAYIEVNRTKQQIAASSVTRMFDEETLRTETEKLRVGKINQLSGGSSPAGSIGQPHRRGAGPWPTTSRH